jgi:pyruvate formate lyase activating enzyme
VVECQLCPRHCKVADQETGWCGVRANDGGTYYTHVYGRPVTIHNDPVEKKPLFHFRPGTEALSLSTAGCNFECLFCQNWEISQFRPEQVPARYGFVGPEKLVALAQRKGSASIAFTYGEPVVFSEYMLDTARASRQAGIPGVMITNGFIEEKPMADLLEVLGAVKVDFKAYSEPFYKKWCRGHLAPVLETLKRIRARKVWLELVHLTIPSLNDAEDETRALCDWVLENLGPDVPVHFTRFHPTYRLKNQPRTPVSTIEKQYRIARAAGLHYPYVGNLPGHEGEHTRCHHCGQLLIRRIGFRVLENKIVNGACPACHKSIPGVWTWPQGAQAP